MKKQTFLNQTKKPEIVTNTMFFNQRGKQLKK